MAVETEKYLFLENLTHERSVFRAANGKFVWEPNGRVGSIVEVPERVVNDPFMRRNLKRERLRLLTDKEAAARQEQLVLPDEAEVTNLDLIQEALSKGASEKSGSRYRRDDLPDSGRERGEISSDEIWDAHREEVGQPRTVRRSGTDPVAEDLGVDGPLAPEAVLTKTVKQGEWTPDTDKK